MCPACVARRILVSDEPEFRPFYLGEGHRVWVGGFSVLPALRSVDEVLSAVGCSTMGLMGGRATWQGSYVHVIITAHLEKSRGFLIAPLVGVRFDWRVVGRKGRWGTGAEPFRRRLQMSR